MIQVETVVGSGKVVKIRSAQKILGRSAYFTAAYWVDGLFVDTGCAHTARQFLQAVKDWRIDTIANTHCHEDHIGANATLQEAFHCRILAHPEALPVLANPRLQELQPYRKLFWGWPRPSQAGPIGEFVETENHRFQVITTPGHSPDHIALLEPEQGWLFSGDSYIGGQDRALRAGYDIWGIIASLKKMAALPVQMIFAGSGSVRSNGVQPLLDKIAYLEEMGERVRTLHAEGLPAKRIQQRLCGRPMPIAYITLGHFSGMHLVRSYLSGLEAQATAQAAPAAEEVM